MTDAATPSAAPRCHTLRVRVGWGQCDPAGIVYFPRFFELFHEAMESWFDRALQLPYHDVIVARRIGLPSVHTEADFVRPTRFGEDVCVELRVLRLGRSSIELGYRIVGVDRSGAALDTDVRATGRTVCAVMDLDPDSPGFRRATPVPEDMRARIEAFGVG